MLVREQRANFECWKGEWESKDSGSRIRIHFHRHDGGVVEFRQLFLNVVGIGTFPLWHTTRSPREEPLPCDLEEE